MSNRACIWDQAGKGSCWECFSPTKIFYSRLWIFPFFCFVQTVSFLCLPFSCHFFNGHFGQNGYLFPMNMSYYNPRPSLGCLPFHVQRWCYLCHKNLQQRVPLIVWGLTLWLLYFHTSFSMLRTHYGYRLYSVSHLQTTNWRSTHTTYGLYLHFWFVDLSH